MGVMQVPLQCLCPNIVHASVLKVSYMCLDTSAGTSGNRGGARPSFRMRGPICAGPYLMPPKLLCSLLRQLMWRYRATTYLVDQSVVKQAGVYWLPRALPASGIVDIDHWHTWNPCRATNRMTQLEVMLEVELSAVLHHVSGLTLCALARRRRRLDTPRERP